MKRAFLFIPCLALAFLHLPSSAFATLEWDTKLISQEAGPLDREVVASFKFKNIGSEPVQITEVKPSCGCTTTDLMKKTYQAGESGEIKATFTIGGRRGLQMKTIQVSTSDSGEPTVLTMKTMIPSIVTITPGYVFWRVGDTTEPKFVKIEVGLDEPVHVVSAHSNNPNMAVELIAEEDGKSYQLKIHPQTTTNALRSIILVETDYPQDKPRNFSVYAHVKSE